MIFRKMRFDDIDIVREYFLKYNTGLNYNTLGGFFAWREWLNTEFAIEDDSLFMRIEGKRNGNLYCLPMTSNLDNAIYKLSSYAKEQNILLALYPILGQELEICDKYFTYELYQTTGSDYIYDFETLKNLSGRKLHGQKNHLNFFKKTFVDTQVLNVDKNNVNKLKDFILKVKNPDKENTENMYKDELKYSFEVIDNFEKYHYDGILALYKGEIIGFVLGETIKNTVYLHIMKIDKNYRGVAQFIITEYLKLVNSDVKFVNMEDDAGDEDLKYTKTCYHPLDIVAPKRLIVKEYKV